MSQSSPESIVLGKVSKLISYVPISVLRYISELEKQQEQMYSEEELIKILEKRDKYLGNWLPPKKWLDLLKINKT